MKKPIAVACDIERMFYNFRVAERDRDFLRFLWYNSDDETIQCRMTVHLFGASSSPAVATYGLRFLANIHDADYPAAAQFIRRDFYVDDGITSVSNTNEGKSLIQDARRICADGNLRLHKFVSNDKKVLEHLPTSELAEAKVDLFKDTQSTQRTLGLEWETNSDKLVFNNRQITAQPATRRRLLSVIGQLFNPLGLLAPVTLAGKNILREVN